MTYRLLFCTSINTLVRSAAFSLQPHEPCCQDGKRGHRVARGAPVRVLESGARRAGLPGYVRAIRRRRRDVVEAPSGGTARGTPAGTKLPAPRGILALSAVLSVFFPLTGISFLSVLLFEPVAVAELPPSSLGSG